MKQCLESCGISSISCVVLVLIEQTNNSVFVTHSLWYMPSCSSNCSTCMLFIQVSVLLISHKAYSCAAFYFTFDTLQLVQRSFKGGIYYTDSSFMMLYM